LHRPEVVDEPGEEAGELVAVAVVPSREHVGHVTGLDVGHPLADLAALGGGLHQRDAPVAGAGAALDQALLLEGADLAAGGARVHVGAGRQLTQRQWALLDDALQQEVAGRAEGHPGGGHLPGVHLPARPQPQQPSHGPSEVLLTHARTLPDI
jgi:hypothetical protein